LKNIILIIYRLLIEFPAWCRLGILWLV